VPTAEIYRIYLLRPGARPRRHRPLSIDEVNAHRCIECANYNDCLLFVARSPWEGFSCDRCPAFVTRRHG
jgi:hypothetical protein